MLASYHLIGFQGNINIAASDLRFQTRGFFLVAHHACALTSCLKLSRSRFIATSLHTLTRITNTADTSIIRLFNLNRITIATRSAVGGGHI